MSLYPDNAPTREECERDEASRPAFVWNPTPEELAYWASTDPWAPTNHRQENKS